MNIKKILFTISLMFAVQAISAQEYLKNVTLDSDNGLYATFISEGKSSEKGDVEENAIKSVFYTLIYEGVEGINDGEPIPQGDCKSSLLNSFFNSKEHYKNYLRADDTETINKPKKVNGVYRGTYRVTVEIKRLIKDLDCQETALPMPRIMVVPFKKDENESYKDILNNDRNLRAAVNEVIRGFNEENIATQNVSALDRLQKRTDAYTSGAANSNERMLLRSADADVYVEVDMEIVEESNGKKVSLIMGAYETASLVNWANATFSSRVSNSNDIAALSVEALKRNNNLRGFLDQIVEAYRKPAKMMIEFAVSEDSDATLYDRCNDGTRLMEHIETWINQNSYKHQYSSQGGNNYSIIYDRVDFARADKKGNRLTANKIAMDLCDALYEKGVESDFVTEGHKIIITVVSVN